MISPTWVNRLRIITINNNNNVCIRWRQRERLTMSINLVIFNNPCRWWLALNLFTISRILLIMKVFWTMIISGILNFVIVAIFTTLNQMSLKPFKKGNRWHVLFYKTNWINNYDSIGDFINGEKRKFFLIKNIKDKLTFRWKIWSIL